MPLVSRFNPLNPERILWLRKRRRRRRRRRPRSRRRSNSSARVGPWLCRTLALPGHPASPGERFEVRGFEARGFKVASLARLFSFWFLFGSGSWTRAPCLLPLRKSQLCPEKRKAAGEGAPQPGHDTRTAHHAVAYEAREQAVQHEHDKSHRHEGGRQLQHSPQRMNFVGCDELRQERQK